MYIFLPIIIVSASVILVIFLRKMPQAKQVPTHNASAFYESWLYKIPNKIKNFHFDIMKESFLNFIEKLLRKFKVVVLKVENVLSDLVIKLRSRRQNGKDAKEAIFLEQSLVDENDLIEPSDNTFSESENITEEEESDEEIIAEDIIADISEEDEVIEEEPENYEFEEEEKKILLAIKENPKDANAYRDLGFLYKKNGDLKDAQNSFEQAVKLGYNGGDVKRALEKVRKHQ